MFGLTPYNRNQRNFQTLVNRMFNDSFFPEFMVTELRADTKENENEYSLAVEVPGITKEQIEITYNDDTLTVTINKREETNEEIENYIRKERREGSYSRSFYLPAVDEKNISAKCENGILKILLPKDKSKPVKQRIQID